jgi:DNA-binding CsgD family transcriptional regulator
MNSQSSDELITSALAAARHLEFEQIAFGVNPDPLSGSSEVTLLNSYSVDWNNRYLESGFALVDPVVIHGSQSAHPFTWSELKSQNRALWEDAAPYGISVGWSKATHHPTMPSSLLSISRPSEELHQTELMEKTPYLLWLTSVVEQQFSLLSQRSASPPLRSVLSDREIEVLKWTAEGKTLFEIGIILGISERTVRFHINNSIKKLDTVNRTAAVAKSVLLGLFDV